MKRLFVFIVLFLLLTPLSLAQSIDEFVEIEEGEEIEGRYNVQTVITKNNAYIILVTEKPGKCEYGMEEFKYGEGKKFEEINGTIHRAKINIEEGTSYRFKIKCVVEGERGEENIMFSVSHITFFLLERLEELKNDVKLFSEEKTYYEDKLDVSDLNLRIVELEDIIKEAEGSIEANEIEKLRLAISDGIRKKDEIENLFAIKSIQFSILKSSRYVIISIVLIYLLLYLISSFFIPYFRLKKNLKKLEEKEGDMVKLRKNTESLYFQRRIDEETFNKMVVKEQEEVMRLRVKISNMGNTEKELIKKLFEPKTVVEWSLKESIHIKDRVKKFLERMKSIKGKIK